MAEMLRFIYTGRTQACLETMASDLLAAADKWELFPSTFLKKHPQQQITGMPWSDWKWCVKRRCVPGSPSTTSPTFSSLQTSILLSSWKLRSALMLDDWVLHLGPLAGDRVHQQPARDGRGGDRGVEADGGNPSTPHRRGVQGPRLPADSPDGPPEEETEVGKVAPGFGHFRAQGSPLLCATNPAVALNSQNKTFCSLVFKMSEQPVNQPPKQPLKRGRLISCSAVVPHLCHHHLTKCAL